MRSIVVILLMVLWCCSSGQATPVVIWNQSASDSLGMGAAAYSDSDSTRSATATDDFQSIAPAQITKIVLSGWSHFGNDYLYQFNLRIYANGSTNRPSTLLHNVTLSKASASDPDKIGWIDNLDGTITLNYPTSNLFTCQGTNSTPVTYWLWLQALPVADSAADIFYWSCRNRASYWGSPALWTSADNGVTTWAKLGFDRYGTMTWATGTEILATWSDLAFSIHAELLDTTPPTGSIVIGSGEAYTPAVQVALGLSAQDASGISQMSFSNDGAIYSAWQPYATSSVWTLSSGDGMKTVYVKYKDEAGNISQALSDTIALGVPVSIPVAKTRLPGSFTVLDDVQVAAVFSDCIYVQDPDRISGTRVVGVAGVATGDTIDVAGVLNAQDGERVLQATIWSLR